MPKKVLNMLSISNNTPESIWFPGQGYVQADKKIRKKNKKENNSQKVTFNTAVADLRVLCVQMREGD